MATLSQYCLLVLTNFHLLIIVLHEVDAFSEVSLLALSKENMEEIQPRALLRSINCNSTLFSVYHREQTLTLQNFLNDWSVDSSVHSARLQAH